jgi:dihydrofolate reductase
MRPLIVWDMVSLDGYFEGRQKGDIDFHESGWGAELEQFSLVQLREVGALLFGRVTYEGMAGYWTTASGEIAEFMNSIPKIVFSRTLDHADWRNTRLVNTGAEGEVARLKDESGKPLFIFGSADLTASLMRAGLVDEYRIAINPILLGGGNPLFKELPQRIDLKLLEARPLATGCVLLRYQADGAH